MIPGDYLDNGHDPYAHNNIYNSYNILHGLGLGIITYTLYGDFDIINDILAACKELKINYWND